MRHRLRGLGEGHEVTQLFADGKDRDGGPLLLGEVIAAQGLGIQPGEVEVVVVDHHVLDPGGAEDPR
jgi:hypothetical protein